MTQICRFYQRGNCRYGQNCTFLHQDAFGGNAFGSSQSANYGTQTRLGDVFNIPTQDAIRMDLVERPTWPLSSYGPGKDPPAQLIDGRDVSPEEVRIMAYKLRAEGNFTAYEAEWQRLTSQVQSQVTAILNDLPGAVNFLKTAYEHGTPSRYRTPSASAQGKPGFGNQQSAVGSSSPFGRVGQSQPAFGQPAQPTSPFGSSSHFGARPTPAFGQTSFGQPPSQAPAAPAFGRPTFGSPSQPQSAFGRPAFGQPTFGQPSMGQSSSPFGAAGTATTATAGPSAFGQSSAPHPTPAFGASGFGTTSAPKPAFSQPAFGQSSAFPATSSPFSQSSTAAAPSPFAQAASTTPFAQPGQSQTNISGNPFSTAQQQTSSPFQQATTQTTASSFSNVNPFQQGQQAQQVTSSPFQQAAPRQPASPFAPQSPRSPSAFPNTAATAVDPRPSAFSNQNPFQSGSGQRQSSSGSSGQEGGRQINQQLRELQRSKKWDDPVIEFTTEEKKEFASDSFTPGSVPTVAPSREMCWG